jgi:hypothetical protein
MLPQRQCFASALAARVWQACPLIAGAALEEQHAGWLVRCLQFDTTAFSTSQEKPAGPMHCEYPSAAYF